MTLKDYKKTKCEAFLFIIKLLNKKYRTLTNPIHKKVFEFGIASIITNITNKDLAFWTRKISKNLLLAMRDLNQTKYSDDHVPPRQDLALKYLNDPKYETISLADFINEIEKLIKFNMVTSIDNQNLKNKTYQEAGVKLTCIEEERKKLFSNNTTREERKKLSNKILERLEAK